MKQYLGDNFDDDQYSQYNEDDVTSQVSEHTKKHMRKLIPAVTHNDGTGRLQTITKKDNTKIYELITEFNKLTGVPIILNTSFNINGEPIVCSPADAIKTFYSSGIDYLVMGNFLIEK